MTEARCNLIDPTPLTSAGLQASMERESREIWVPLSYAGDGILARLAMTYLESAGIAARIASDSGRIYVEVPLQQITYARQVCCPVECSVVPLLSDKATSRPQSPVIEQLAPLSMLTRRLNPATAVLAAALAAALLLLASRLFI